MSRARTQLQSRTRAKLHKIVRLEAMEKSPEAIAASVGLTVGTLSELTKHPEYRKLQEKYLAHLYEPTDQAIAERKAGPILEEASPDAADKLAALIYSEDDVTARIAATAVLDRTGHGPIQRKATRVRHELDPAALELLKEGLKVADKAKQLKSRAIDVEPVE